MRFRKDTRVLNFFPGWSLGASECRPSANLVNGLYLNDYISAVSTLYHFFKISKFQCTFSYATSWVSEKNKNSLNLERQPYSGGDAGMQPAGLFTVYGTQWLTYSHIWTPAIFWMVLAQVAHSYCVSTSLPRVQLKAAAAIRRSAWLLL